MSVNAAFLIIIWFNYSFLLIAMTVTAAWAQGGVTPGKLMVIVGYFTPKLHQVILIFSDPDSVSPDP